MSFPVRFLLKISLISTGLFLLGLRLAVIFIHPKYQNFSKLRGQDFDNVGCY